MSLGRVRVALDMNMRMPLLFLARANAIYTGLLGHPAIFVTPSPGLPTVLGQIQDATTAQGLVGTGAHGAAAARDAKFRILATSMESERMMVQGLCDSSPNQALTIIAAASMKPVAVGQRYKPLLKATTATPSGTVLLVANVRLLDQTSRLKTFHWRYTLDGAKSFLPMPSTPVGKTSLSGLVPLTSVGFEVSVTVNEKAQSAWSPTIYVLVR